MVTISILTNTQSDHLFIAERMILDTAFGAVAFSWQDPVHSWKAGPGEVMILAGTIVESNQ